ncbi:hypothetical protein BVRB_7g179360 [Beta vulgaris subsp. vulgaris]|uniref:Uncharacterized protein n=1 Tax=Beta vulgaris subsp. vulgaris TaxID=3555 RepID=A0A0J8BAR8_BETVV|nr:hypothetical protein BVRB_7g179360 [Beta vulgaris subsp. vulgaris]
MKRDFINPLMMITLAYIVEDTLNQQTNQIDNHKNPNKETTHQNPNKNRSTGIPMNNHRRESPTNQPTD